MTTQPVAPAPPVSRHEQLFTGLDCHFLEWGGDDATLDHTLVLVHGFLDLAWGWVPTVQAGLAGRFHVVACDVRGHGDSGRVGAGGYYHFMDYVADLAALCEKVGRARVTLIGHSMGGSVVSYLAGAMPELPHKVALLEGTGPPEDGTTVPERVGSWIAAWKRARTRPQKAYPSLEAAAARLRQTDAKLGVDLSLWLAEKGTLPVPGGRQWKHDPLHVTRGPYPFRLDVAEAHWRRTRCPVLLVEGSESMFRHTPEEAARRRACFADARSVLIDGAAHMMARHRPEALAQVLAEFCG